MSNPTKINKKTEADRIFEQLSAFKKELTQLKKEIKYRRNQFSFLFNNTLSRHTVDIDLDFLYKKYNSELNKINLKNLEKYRGHYTRCFNERCEIVGRLARLDFEYRGHLDALNSELSREFNTKKHFYLKKRIADFKNVIIDKPISIVENCFDAEIVRPEKNTEVVKDEMDEICLSRIDTIDTFKGIHKKKLGSFVDQCLEYGAKDKKTGEYIITPAVSIYTVELADKLKMFQVVK